MAEKSAKKTTPAKRTATSTSGSFTAEGRAAMKARAQGSRPKRAEQEQSGRGTATCSQRSLR